MKILMAFFLSAMAFNAWSETRDFDVLNIKKLQISNPKGLVEVSTNAKAKKMTVKFQKIEFARPCQFTITETLNTLQIKISQENVLFEKGSCIGNLFVELPASAIAVDVTTATAPITIKGTSSHVEFKTATGPVLIQGEILKNVEGTTATGNMTFSFNKCVGRADLELISATGDAEISLPASCKIKVAHKSATGELFNELGESEDYLVFINAKSAGGNLRLKKVRP